MSIPKYAKLENERRFLVRPTALAGLALADPRLIEDLYLDDTRLRLRRITSDAGQAFKLCKKYESADPTSGPVVNIYLTKAEHTVLAALPGRWIIKRRHGLTEQGCAFGVNVFEGALTGLVLAEVEAESLSALAAIRTPDWAQRDVTAEPFFTGGCLASASAEALRRALG